MHKNNSSDSTWNGTKKQTKIFFFVNYSNNMLMEHRLMAAAKTTKTEMSCTHDDARCSSAFCRFNSYTFANFRVFGFSRIGRSSLSLSITSSVVQVLLTHSLTRSSMMHSQAKTRVISDVFKSKNNKPPTD